MVCIYCAWEKTPGWSVITSPSNDPDFVSRDAEEDLPNGPTEGLPHRAVNDKVDGGVEHEEQVVERYQYHERRGKAASADRTAIFELFEFEFVRIQCLQ